MTTYAVLHIFLLRYRRLLILVCYLLAFVLNFSGKFHFYPKHRLSELLKNEDHLKLTHYRL